MAAAGWVGGLSVTFTVQLTISFVSSAVVVAAPMLTAVAGVPIERIGYFSSISTIGSMWYFMSCGALLGQVGSLRLLQVGLVIAAISMLAVLTGLWPAVLAASFFFGVGYGPVPGAGSDILARRVPAERRSLAFSMNQAGIPAGQALSGLAIPALALAFGWRAALAAASVACILLVLGLQPLRRRFDEGRTGFTLGAVGWGRLLTPANLAQPWRAIAGVPGLPGLTYASFCLACAQGSLFTFFVAFLTADLGLALIAAGTAYAVLQAAGAVARIIAGWVADRISAVVTLMVLGASSCVALVLVASLSGASPRLAVLGTAFFAGVAAISWNGVFLGEVARLAPAGKVGESTSASSFFTFIGYAAGPAVFSMLVEATGRYDVAFLVFAALPASAIPALLRIRRRAAGC